ncbi:hypothetical protein ACS78_08255 [Priestia megaterium]|uniref:hypothetical protein n=1 Tax=Priestia megaterium TaxID=1404 RepID=UPI0006837164|nr:hypothetical protein [Priestia megaterium]KNH23934.1 hypothetical protein ACS78_08255 [Priestia megaterium]
MAFLMDFIVDPGVNIASLIGDSEIESYILNVPYTVEQGYVRVESIQGTKESLVVILSYRKSSDGFILKKKIIDFSPSLDDGAVNYHKQIYEYLKQTEEFSMAVDILEQGQTA